MNRLSWQCSPINILLKFQFMIETYKQSLINMYRSHQHSMVSQSSMRSKSSGKTLNSMKLNALQSELFYKIVGLKSEKIRMMTELSSAIDARFRAESEFIMTMDTIRKKQERMASRADYEPILNHYYDLKNIEGELLRRMVSKSPLQAEIQENLVDDIIEMREKNFTLEQQIQKDGQDFSMENQMRKIEFKLNRIEKIIEQKESMLQFQQRPPSPLNLNEQKINLADFYSFIREEERNKQLLYEEIIEFQNQMDLMREQNDYLQRKLNQH